MKKWLLLLPFLFLPVMGHAQVVGPGFVDYVTSAPSGSCSSNAHQRNVMGLGTVYTCQSGTWAQISGGGGGCAEGTCVVNAPVGNQTILGNHELNIPGLVGAGTSVDGYLNVGPAITALSAYAQTVALPANEFSLNVTTNEPDLTHNFAAAQFVLDAATTFSNVINVFAAVKLAANDTTGVTLEGNFTEANVNLNGHTTTSGITGTQSNAQLNGTGTLGGNNIGMQAIPVFQSGTQSATSSWGVDSFAFNLPQAVTLTLSGEAAAFHATTPAVNAQTITVPINAQFLAESNSGTTPTLNAEFYGKDNGTGSPDYFIYDAGTLVKSKLGALTVGALTSNGTVTAPTYATTGSNSAITGVEGTGSNCTPASSVDCLWPDSTAHRWKMNNNNGASDNVIGTTTTDTLTNKTLTTPTIGSFVNATHTHANAAGGGQLGVAAVSATGTPSSTTFWRGDNTWSVPAGNAPTLDAVLSPVANVSFTAPATNTYSFLGTAPGSGAGAGTAAGTHLTVTAPAGGATTGSATTGGAGGDIAITSGAGGSGAGGTNANGGRGGNITFAVGAGGAKSGSGVVGATGQVVFPVGGASTQSTGLPGITFSGFTQTGFGVVTNNLVVTAPQGFFITQPGVSTGYLALGAHTVQVGSGDIYSWSSGTAPITNSSDTGVSRDSAAVVDIGAGAQGDFTGTIKAATHTVGGLFGSTATHTVASCETAGAPTTLATGATTTNTGLNCLPANSIIDAVVARVTTTITASCTGWELGDATTATRFSINNTVLTAGTTTDAAHIGTFNNTGIASATTGTWQAAAAPVKITCATGNPGAGAIRIFVFYHTWGAPTS